jgi:plasmid maintenance system antidote protein VapI
MSDVKDTSHKLLDHIIKANKLKNDAALARFLEQTPAAISKVRHGRLNVSAQMVIDIHLATGMAVRDIQALLN